MSSIVVELQKEALDSTQKTTDLLRKAYVVAKKLKLHEFLIWIEAETNGYKETDNIPEYRRVSGLIKAKNPYHGWIPVVFEDPSQQELLSSRLISQPISELELFAEESKGQLIIHYPANVEAQLMQGDDLGLVPVLLIQKASVVRIIDIVRNIILQWAIQLEEDGVIGEEMSFTEQERRVASTQPYTVNHFYGDIHNAQIQQGTVGSTQSINTQSNYEEITKLLIELRQFIVKFEVDENKFNEICSDIETIQTQIKSSNPKKQIIKECLNSTRNIIEGISGSLLASAIIDKISLLIK